MTGRQIDAAISAMDTTELEQLLAERHTPMFRSEYQELAEERAKVAARQAGERPARSSWWLVLIGVALVGVAVWKMGL